MSSSTTTTSVSGGGPPPPTTTRNYFNNIGPGYVIAIALGFLVLLSTLILASYVCCRNNGHRSRRRQNQQNPNPNNTASEDGIIVPRILFVAEDEDDNNENAVVGLDPSVICSYPKFPFSKDRGGGGVNDSMCSICLCEYRDAEMLRMLPDCRHYFHLTCVDAWLKLNASCPVCRNSPLPTPLSTPLSEVVPLSQYSDGRRRS